MPEISTSKIDSMEARTETPTTQDQSVEVRVLSFNRPPSFTSRDNHASNSPLDITPVALSPPARLDKPTGHTLTKGPLDEANHRPPPRLTNVTYTSSAAAAAINAQIQVSRTILSQIRRERKAFQAANGIVTGATLKKCNRLQVTRARQRKVEASLLKEGCMQCEVVRAKKTRIEPKMIRTLDLSTIGELCRVSKRRDSRIGRFNPIPALIERIVTFFYAMPSPSRLLTRKAQPQISTPLLPLHGIVNTEQMRTDDGRNMQNGFVPWGFEGDIVIQKHLDAMAHALSEHTQDGPQLQDPGCHSYYVDAAVSRANSLTGLAVVNMSHRQDCASPWTVQGYRVHIALEQHDAEVCAIWQALQCVLDKIKANGDSEMPLEPCSLVIIYSDSKSALHGISHNSGGFKVQEIIRQSVELKKLGVSVQLHWVPGHRNIPGNELADLVSKKARLLTWQDSDLS